FHSWCPAGGSSWSAHSPAASSGPSSMMNEPLAHGALIGIVAMAAATLLTRVAGYWLMGHVPMTRRVRRCLEILPGAIMADARPPARGPRGPAPSPAPPL